MQQEYRAVFREEPDGTWIYECLYNDMGYRQGFRCVEVLEHAASDFFEVLIFRTRSHGKVLMIDGIVQLTERDEFVYHEMLTHVPILAHGNVRDVLIIGGGDGGMARRALMHPDVHVTQVELDRTIVDLSIKHLSSVCGDTFTHARHTLALDDGKHFVSTTDKRFDVICTDLTDPVGPAAELFALPFYRNCKRVLREDGILVTQNGVPHMQADELTDVMKALRSLFVDVTCYRAAVPTYVGGDMAFGWATDNPDHRRISKDELQERFAASGIKTLQYNADVHIASFALPPHVERLLG